MVDRVTDEMVEAFQQKYREIAKRCHWDYSWPSQDASRELIEAALSASDKERQTPEGWKSIESAPKDGTEILLYGPGVLFVDGRSSMYAKARHVGWWHNDFWATRDPAVTCRATRWMPLPAAPVAAP